MNTVRVRIAVAVNAKGQWSATGDGCDTDVERRTRAIKGLFDVDCVHVVFVEADVPLPEDPLTVAGTTNPGPPR